MSLVLIKFYDVAVTAAIRIKCKNDEEALKLAREYYKEDVGRLNMDIKAYDGLEPGVGTQPVAVPVVEATPVVAPVAEPVEEPVTPIA
jgi:hypothetical protein